MKVITKSRGENNGYIGLASTECRLYRTAATLDARNLEASIAGEPRANGPGRDIGNGVDEQNPHRSHIGPHREPEDHDHCKRKEQQDEEGLPVAENVPYLLQHESFERGRSAKFHHHATATAGRARRTNTSSSVAASNRALSSSGAPIAPIRPSTMIDTLSQY